MKEDGEIVACRMERTSGSLCPHLIWFGPILIIRQARESPITSNSLCWRVLRMCLFDLVLIKLE